MITEKIRKLRIEYSKETARLEEEYNKRLAELNGNLSKVKTADYYKPYCDRYSEFCSVMEEYYQKILTAEKDIHGLDFYASEYLLTDPLSESDIEEDVEKVFAELAKESRAVVEELNNSHTVKEYGELLTYFCDMLFAMRYIVKNSIELLKKSEGPANDRQKAINEAEKEISLLKEQYLTSIKPENLSCGRELMSLKKELEDIYEKTSSELLGAVTLGDDKQYRYPVGFHVEKIEECDARFCEEVLGVGREKLGREPVYLDPRNGRCNLIVNAPNAFLSSHDCYELIRNIYFSVASRVDKNMLQFGYIECKQGRGIVESIYVSIDTSDADAPKRLGEDGNFCYKGVNTHRADSVKKCIEIIDEDCRNIVNHHGNLIEYNIRTEKNKLPLKIVVVNLYPMGFVDQSRTEQAYSSLKMLMREYSDSGCMFVVCQDTDNPILKNEDVLLDSAECNAIELSLDKNAYLEWKRSGKRLEQCEFTIDKKPAVVDIAEPGFDGEKYWEKLKRFYMTKKIFALREVFKKTDIQTNNWQKQPSVFDDGAIEIPLGLSGSDDYSIRYSLSSACHTLIYGGSGSGKSSFLHTMILSMCYKYSAEDIQIYLADFKKSEFGFYVENKLPHIKYYLLKNGASEVRDTFEMVECIRKERNELITAHGCKDIIQYNKLVKSSPDGSLKKMPMIFFIIDEYQVIQEVTGANNREMEEINRKISTIFSQARSVGIALCLCGQNVGDISALNAGGNISTYVLMGTQIGNDSIIRKYFLGDDYNYSVDDVKGYLSVLKNGHCFIKTAKTKVGDKVRVAFPGDGASEKKEYIRSILSLPRKENEKKISMILGGSEDPVCVDEYADYHDTMLKDSETSFNLCLGIASTLGLPTYIMFSGKEDNCGWLIHSKDPDRIYNITRNAVFAFMYKTAAFGYDYGLQSIKERTVYFGDTYSYSKVLGDKYFAAGEGNCISGHVKQLHVSSEMYEDSLRKTYEACEQIMALRREMTKRHEDMERKGIRFSKTKEYPPYLVIFQSLEWFDKEKIDRVIRDHNEAVKSVENDTASDIPSVDENMRKYEIKGFSLNKALLAQQKRRSGMLDKPSEPLTVSMVMNAFKDLFERGNRYGIFVLLSTISKEKLRSVIGTDVYSEEKYWNNAVCGTFGEFNDSADGAEEKDASGMICHVGSQRVKTRLYEYSPSSQHEWWEDLGKMMKGDQQ